MSSLRYCNTVRRYAGNYVQVIGNITDISTVPGREGLVADITAMAMSLAPTDYSMSDFETVYRTARSSQFGMCQVERFHYCEQRARRMTSERYRETRLIMAAGHKDFGRLFEPRPMWHEGYAEKIGL
jgi:hypothetical protein